MPDARSRLRTGPHDDLVEMLTAGEIELVVGYGMQSTETLDTEELYQDHMHAIFSAVHPSPSRAR